MASRMTSTPTKVPEKSLGRPAVESAEPKSDKKVKPESDEKVQPESKKKVLILLNNDLPDWDNLAIFLLFATVVQDLEKKFGKSAIQKLFILELHNVNLAVERIQGKNIPTFLVPMFNILFKEKGPVQSNRHEFNRQVNKDIDLVLERRGISLGCASTFMRADLTKALVDAIVGHEEIMKTLVRDLLRLENFQVNQKFRGPCSCRQNWAKPCGTCKFRYGSIEEQMMTCVPSRDPKDWKGSLLAGNFYAQDYLKVLDDHGFLKSGDKVFLDRGGLPYLTAPLEARAEHPGHLVNHPHLVKFCQFQKDKVPDENQRRQKIRDYMQKSLDPKFEKMIDDTTIDDKDGKGRYKTIIDAGKEAKKIFFYGGSSMTLLNELISAGLGKKIEFVGQGGAKNVKLNLTGNSFNWDLNPSAAYSVLNRQANKNDAIPEFMLGSTELGKQRLFTGKDLASAFVTKGQNDRFGRRIAAFGVPELKINPEEFILDMQIIDSFNQSENAAKPKEVIEAENKYASYLSKPVQGADLVAFLAAYSKSFRAYCIPYQPKYMFIVKKLGRNGDVLDAVERVRFGDDKTKTNEREICKPLNGSVTLFTPKPTGKETTDKDPDFQVVKMTSTMITEVKETMEKKVRAALELEPAAAPSTNSVPVSSTVSANSKPQQDNKTSAPAKPASKNSSGAGGMPPLTKRPVLSSNGNSDHRPVSRGSNQATAASNGAPRHNSTGAPPAGGRPPSRAASGPQVRRSEKPGPSR